MTKRYVLAGGPGVGKSTLMEILASRGHAIVPETSRIVIEEEKLKKSDVLPWKDIQRFQEVVAKRQLKAERECTAEVAFLDRGLIDGYAYCILAKVHVPTLLMENLRLGKENRPRYDKIFMLDPLPSYVTDDARWEDRNMQIKVHKAMEDAYRKLGYTPVHVPVLPPEKRADFILKSIAGK